jgi:hypothetical protein
LPYPSAEPAASGHALLRIRTSLQLA